MIKNRFSGGIIPVRTSISDSNITLEKTQSPIRYPSDLIDEEWEILQPVFDELEPYTTGRQRTTDLREILNAIFYLNKTGCPWRYLPTDFPPYRLANYYYRKWMDNRTLEKANTALRQKSRENKVETQTRRQPSLTVKASREPQSPVWNQGSMEESSVTISGQSRGLSFVSRSKRLSGARTRPHRFAAA